MSQLWETFQAAAGNRFQIGDVMDTWTRQMGYPVVKVSHVTGTDNYVLSQTRFLVNPSDQYNVTDSPFGFVCHCDVIIAMVTKYYHVNHDTI